MKLLLTAIGKRIQLIEHLNTKFYIIGVDSSASNPAKEFVEEFVSIPACTDPSYQHTILSICKKERIKVLIPLYEKEFLTLCDIREDLEAEGTKLILSDREVIEACNDKAATAVFFEKYQIPAPRTFTDAEIQEFLKSDEEDMSIPYPFIIKPRDGMGSVNVFQIHNKKELDFFYGYVKNPIVQEMATGDEYTIDVLCDYEGNPVYIVPRLRLEVRSGEVSKSRISRNQKIIDATRNLLEQLKKEGNVMGPLTIQCFYDDSKEGEEPVIKFIEVNPRFGGGVPLSIQAGADYAGALRAMREGKKLEYTPIEKELTMLRYDQAIYEEMGLKYLW